MHVRIELRVHNQTKVLPVQGPKVLLTRAGCVEVRGIDVNVAVLAKGSQDGGSSVKIGGADAFGT